MPLKFTSVKLLFRAKFSLISSFLVSVWLGRNEKKNCQQYLPKETRQRINFPLPFAFCFRGLPVESSRLENPPPLDMEICSVWQLKLFIQLRFLSCIKDLCPFFSPLLVRVVTVMFCLSRLKWIKFGTGRMWLPSLPQQHRVHRPRYLHSLHQTTASIYRHRLLPTSS